MTLMSRILGIGMPRAARAEASWAWASFCDSIAATAVLAIAAPNNSRLRMVSPLGFFDWRERKWTARKLQFLFTLSVSICLKIMLRRSMILRQIETDKVHKTCRLRAVHL